MSGTMPPNPLQDAAAGPPPPEPAKNPLASPKARPIGGAPVARPQPTVAEAMAKMQALDPHAVADNIERVNHIAPVLAKLAADSGVSRKDVVRGVADAVAQRKVTATEGIQFLTDMPENAEQLRPWIQQKYQAALVNAVALHAHAHALVGGGGAPAGPAMPGAAPGAPAMPPGPPGAMP